MKKNSKIRHTRYCKFCKFYNICDKEVDCFDGEYCVWFTHNDNLVSIPEKIEEERGEWNMDQFWEDNYE